MVKHFYFPESFLNRVYVSYEKLNETSTDYAAGTTVQC